MFSSVLPFHLAQISLFLLTKTTDLTYNYLLSIEPTANSFQSNNWAEPNIGSAHYTYAPTLSQAYNNIKKVR